MPSGVAASPTSPTRRVSPLTPLPLLLRLFLLASSLFLLRSEAFLLPSSSRTLGTGTSTRSSMSTASTAPAAAPAADGHVVATLHPNRVLELQLNRPRQLNALSIEMLHELTAHVKRAAEDDGVRALLLSAVRRPTVSRQQWLDSLTPRSVVPFHGCDRRRAAAPFVPAGTSSRSCRAG